MFLIIFFWIGPEFKDRQFLIFFVRKLFLTSALTYTVVSGRSITPSALSKQARIDASKKLFGAGIQYTNDFTGISSKNASK